MKRIPIDRLVDKLANHYHNHLKYVSDPSRSDMESEYYQRYKQEVKDRFTELEATATRRLELLRRCNQAMSSDTSRTVKKTAHLRP